MYVYLMFAFLTFNLSSKVHSAARSASFLLYPSANLIELLNIDNWECGG